MYSQALFRRNLLLLFLSCLAGSGLVAPMVVLSQQAPSPSASVLIQEFPVVFAMKVIAGKTPVGTKVQAKLCAATLVNGTVIPRDAIFTGEVTQSKAKTANGPSRLGIRMDSVQWKNGDATGSAGMKAYLTAWYYPTLASGGDQNLQYGPEQPTKKTWNGMGQYPDPHSPSYTPFPNASSDQSPNVPNTPSSATANHRVVMKDIASEVTSDGTVTIISSKTDIKLDKLTTYVLATVTMQPPRPATTK